jgi:hypothetical protein
MEDMNLTFDIIFWENYPRLDGVILFACGA